MASEADVKTREADSAYLEWWGYLTRQGDPQRQPHLVRDAYLAGWQARGVLSSNHSPELVERVADAIQGHMRRTYCDADREALANAALEASGHAELVEALRRIAEHGRKRLRRPNRQTFIAEAALAKRGGRQ